MLRLLPLMLISLVSCSLVCASDQEREGMIQFWTYLEKDCLVPVEYDYRYDSKHPISQAMALKTDGMIELAAIVCPAFDPEKALFVTCGPERDGNGFLPEGDKRKKSYRLYFIRAKTNVSYICMEDPERKLDDVLFSCRSIPLPVETVERLADLWKSNIEARSDDPLMEMLSGLDGIHYEFGIRKERSGYERAKQMNCMIRQNILSLITEALFAAGDDIKPEDIPEIIDACLQAKQKEEQRIAEGLTALPKDRYPDLGYDKQDNKTKPAEPSDGEAAQEQ